MKMRLMTIFLALLTTGGWAQSLGQAAQQVRDSAENLLTPRISQADTWGEQTAVEDLRQLHQSAAALFEALNGDDALAIKNFQQSLSSAARRLKTSQELLPDAAAAAPTVASLEEQVAAIDARLTDLRLRFDEKASVTPGALANLPMAPGEDAFAIYDNPQALLIDVRDARHLAEELAGSHYPSLGVGFNQPNNLDSLQLRRLVLAGWDLQRALEGQFGDISNVMDEWIAFRREYDRMGYPGSNEVTRQLDRVMTRLTAFFDRVASEGAPPSASSEDR
jgi:hypothetical protein